MKKLFYFTLTVLFFAPSLTKAQTLIKLTPQDKENFLAAHNKERRMLGEEDLVWDDELAQFAEQWALNLAKKRQFKHSHNDMYGENLFWSTYKPTPEEAVESWNNEKQYYHGQKISMTNYKKFGHYTQVVWAKTQKVGCAIAKGKKGYYVVCEYYPPGNYIGQKPTDR